MRWKQHNPGGERTRKDHKDRDIPAKKTVWRAMHDLGLP